jgi:hypothetical protein
VIDVPVTGLRCYAQHVMMPIRLISHLDRHPGPPRLCARCVTRIALQGPRHNSVWSLGFAFRLFRTLKNSVPMRQGRLWPFLYESLTFKYR